MAHTHTFTSSFTLSKIDDVDIDECVIITCDTNCTNTIGSFECFSCEEGFLEVQLANGSYICEGDHAKAACNNDT